MRQRAGRYAPPLAWDEDQIDLLGGRPAEGWRRGKDTTRRAVDLAEDAAFVREHGGYRHAPESAVAMRLGVTRPALEKALSRVRQAEMADREAG